MVIGKEYTHSLSVARTPWNGDGRLAVVCGYDNDQYGYFICTERQVNGMYRYDEVHRFFRKEGESTFAVVLDAMRDM